MLASHVFKLLFAGILIFVQLTANCSLAAESGTLVVVNKRGDDVSFIDIASRAIVEQLPTGKGPHELAITNDGKWAVTTDYVGGDSLTVFDVEKMQKVRTIGLKAFPRPHGIVLFQDQRRVAVSSEGSDKVVIADIHSGDIVADINTTQKGSHMVAMPLSSDVVYTTNMADASVSQLNIKDGSLIKLIQTPHTPEAITVSQDGQQLWVGSNKNGLVTIFNADTAEQTAQFSGYTWPYRILLNHSQTFAVVPDYKNNSLDIFNVKTKTKIKRIQLEQGSSPKGVVFHPNNTTLFLSLYDKNQVIAIDIPSGEILYSLPTGDGPDGIGYSALVSNR